MFGKLFVCVSTRKKSIIFAVMLVCVPLHVYLVVDTSNRHWMQQYLLQHPGNKCSENYNYSTFWNYTLMTNFSFNPDLFQMEASNKEEFLSRLKAVFQDKYFLNITCKPRVAHISKTQLNLTALASLPGAGNTWSRHLIEQMTGVQTSSIYCDGSLRSHLKGECFVDKKRAICVKTHFLPTAKKYSFEKAILIIRNPFENLITMFQYSKAGHTGVVNESLFNSTEWYKRANRTVGWVKFNSAWLTQFNNSLHPLLYDNLLDQETFFEELFKLSRFLHTPVTYGALWCVWKNREGSYHRKKRKGSPKAIDRYPPEAKANMFHAIAEVDKVFKEKYGFHLPFFDIL